MHGNLGPRAAIDIYRRLPLGTDISSCPLRLGLRFRSLVGCILLGSMAMISWVSSVGLTHVLSRVSLWSFSGLALLNDLRF